MSTPMNNEAGLLEAFAHLLRDDPDAVMLLEGHAGHRPAVEITRAQVFRHAQAWRELLVDHQVRAGDCVGVWLPNWSEAVAVQLAALSVGAHVIGINTRYNVDEVAHVLTQATPVVIAIAHDFKGLDLLGRLRLAVAASPSQPPLAVPVAGPGLVAPQGDSLASYDVGGGVALRPELPAEAAALPRDVAPGIAVAFTTSGSTGLPKLAAHTEVAVAEHARCAAQAIGIRAGDVLLGVLPLSGVFGFSAAMAAIRGGAAVLLEPVFEDAGAIADMAEHRVTHVVGGDDLGGRLMDAWHAGDRPQLALRWIGIADFEGRSQDVCAWVEREFAGVGTGVYGSSELFALTAFWPAGTDPDIRHTGGGRLVMPDVQVRAADPTTGAPVAPGEEGELQFRGLNVVDQYLGAPAELTSKKTEDGWFSSGDLGRMTGPDSFVYVCRMGDALRLRGFLVDPAEIEWCLAEHPAVRIAKVVGAVGETGGTVAVAFVVPAEGMAPNEEELRAWCAQRLAAFKVPTRVNLLDRMPTTSGVNGTKIRAATLREMAKEAMA